MISTIHKIYDTVMGKLEARYVSLACVLISGISFVVVVADTHKSVYYNHILIFNAAVFTYTSLSHIYNTVKECNENDKVNK